MSAVHCQRDWIFRPVSRMQKQKLPGIFLRTMVSKCSSIISMGQWRNWKTGGRKEGSEPGIGRKRSGKNCSVSKSSSFLFRLQSLSKYPRKPSSPRMRSTMCYAVAVERRKESSVSMISFRRMPGKRKKSVI